MHVTIQFLSYPKDTKEAKNNIGVCVWGKRGAGSVRIFTLQSKISCHTMGTVSPSLQSY